MVEVILQQKPGRRTLMETWGATVTRLLLTKPSPVGRSSPIIPFDGPLGVAISEAVEIAAANGDPAIGWAAC